MYQRPRIVAPWWLRQADMVRQRVEAGYAFLPDVDQVEDRIGRPMTRSWQLVLQDDRVVDLADVYLEDEEPMSPEDEEAFAARAADQVIQDGLF
jgi:phytoene/squalene synthetase